MLFKELIAEQKNGGQMNKVKEIYKTAWREEEGHYLMMLKLYSISIGISVLLLATIVITTTILKLY